MIDRFDEFIMEFTATPDKITFDFSNNNLFSHFEHKTEATDNANVDYNIYTTLFYV